MKRIGWYLCTASLLLTTVGCAALGLGRSRPPFEGIVEDEGRVPISGVTVSLIRAVDLGTKGAPDCVAITKETGKFKCTSLEDGNGDPVPFRFDEQYIIVAEGRGFKTASKTLIYSDSMTPLTVIMVDNAALGSSDVEGSATQSGTSPSEGGGDIGK